MRQNAEMTKLEYLRRHLGISQRELAHGIGVFDAVISNYETRKTPVFSFMTIKKIQAYFAAAHGIKLRYEFFLDKPMADDKFIAILREAETTEGMVLE